MYCVLVMKSAVLFILSVACLSTVEGQEQNAVLVGTKYVHNSELFNNVCSVAGLKWPPSLPNVMSCQKILGDSCVDAAGVQGTCKILFSCQAAVQNLRLYSRLPTHCNNTGRAPVICCTGVVGPVNTTPEPQPTTTKNEEGCVPLDKRITAERKGRKAWDKCLEYQEQLVFPCLTDNSSRKRKSRGNQCLHDADPLVKSGTNAKQYEFPHMVQLKFESGSEDQFCGGSLISERFVLTAAHCTKTSKRAEVSHVLVGGLRRDEGESHRVKKSYVYEQYNPAERYHDIALLELETPLVLTSTTVPACLGLGDEEAGHAAVTGWGRVDYHASTAKVLQKAILSNFTKLECAGLFYEYARVLPRGFDESTQSCYGDRDFDRDTCSGDSGGPLQIKNPRIFCMYTIVGVTQGGIQCGNQGQPALYTKVSFYTPWIESIVWPDN